MRIWTVGRWRWLLSSAAVVVVVVLVVVALAAATGKRAPRSESGWVLVTDPERLRLSCAQYFQGFSPCDAAARRCGGTGSTGCMEDYLSCVVASPDAAVVDRLGRAIAAAQKAIPRELRRGRGVPPWRVAVLEDRAEGGFPHTHGSVVCMPLSHVRLGDDDSELVRTLVHERVHVLQRSSPELFAEAIMDDPATSGRVEIARLPARSDLRTRRRSNPDLDGFAYIDRGTGLAYAMLFHGVREASEGGLPSARVAWIDPRTGDEVVFRSQAFAAPKHEHPYERLAYEIADAAVPPLPLS